MKFFAFSTETTVPLTAEAERPLPLRPFRPDIFRTDLRPIIHSLQPLVGFQGQSLRDDDWLCPYALESWHCPWLFSIFHLHADEADVLWWNTSYVQLVGDPDYIPIWKYEDCVYPGVCGYAIRYGALRLLPEFEQRCLLHNYRHSVINAARLNLKVRYVDTIGGVMVLTPLSWLAARKSPTLETTVVATSREALFPVVASLPDWIYTGVVRIIRLMEDQQLIIPEQAVEEGER